MFQSDIYDLEKITKFFEIPDPTLITDVFHDNVKLYVFFKQPRWPSGEGTEEVDFSIQFTKTECLNRFGK